MKKETFLSILSEKKKSPLTVEYFTALKQISMLHVDALMMISEFSQRSNGVLLEFGPYIGGSTIALAHGLAQRPVPEGNILITVEPGGAYPDQPYLPTNNILEDWKKNVSKYEFIENVDLLVGYSNEKSIKDSISKRLGGRKAGLLFVDANGMLKSDMKMYADIIEDDCLLVLDDYEYDDDLKGESVTGFINDMVRRGFFKKFGFTEWNTWFGAVTPMYKEAVLRGHEAV